MRIILLLLFLLFLLLVQFKSTESAKDIISRPGCQDSCGGIPIPFPFGIGQNCSFSIEFNVTCNTTNDGTSTPYLFLGEYLFDRRFVEILNISISRGQATTVCPILSQCYNNMTKKYEVDHNGTLEMHLTPFKCNPEKNKFVVVGSNAVGLIRSMDSRWMMFLTQGIYMGGCIASSVSTTDLTNGSCSGVGCCQTTIPRGTHELYVWFDPPRFNRSQESEVSYLYNFSHCNYAMVVEEAEFNFRTTYITTDELVGQTMPMVLDWAIRNTTCEDAANNKTSYACRSDHSVCLNSTRIGGYLCNCSHGYQGNPYLDGGCQDIDECANQNACSKPGKCHNFEGGYRCSCPFGWRSNHNNSTECDFNVAQVIGTGAGIVGLIFFGVGIYVLVERRNLSKVKRKYFQQHGGWILLEKIRSNQGFGFTIFTKQQVEQATNNFNSTYIIGHGGQGTVYKGTLRDQTIAVKKCKIVDESKKKEFGKEMLILSQINHKNIVKILGCCLEVEIPMLVYEFVPNGTLYHYIHYKKQGSHISLQTRLRIAQEVAEALAYLHTSASPPIFHGDVKSANILLDHNYTAKVSDFGASILAPTDEAQFITVMQGTCGYLDPEYVQSCQLTSKSDVYSFGVVLLELLTSKPVIDFDAPEEDKSLSSRFLTAMEKMKIHELLDEEIICEDNMQLITEVAEMAKKCLNIKGDERPMMKKVAEELDQISKLNQHPWREENHHQDRETSPGEASHDIEIEDAALLV